MIFLKELPLFRNDRTFCAASLGPLPDNDDWPWYFALSLHTVIQIVTRENPSCLGSLEHRSLQVAISHESVAALAG
jgi:hypothetical protein